MAYSIGEILSVSTSRILAASGATFNYLAIGFAIISITLAFSFVYDSFIRKN